MSLLFLFFFASIFRTLLQSLLAFAQSCSCTQKTTDIHILFVARLVLEVLCGDPCVREVASSVVAQGFAALYVHQYHYKHTTRIMYANMGVVFVVHFREAGSPRFQSTPVMYPCMYDLVMLFPRVSSPQHDLLARCCCCSSLP